MSAAIPTATLRESLGFNLGYAIPISMQGTFTRSRFWVGLLGRLQRDPAAVRRVHRLRGKYASDYLFLRLGLTRTLLVLHPDGIRRVLDHSPDPYGPPRPKREGMAHFQPDAVAIATGAAWRARRGFNEAVLRSDRPMHPDAEGFLEVVRDELRPAAGAGVPPLAWDDFDRLFGRLTRRVLFGPAARDDVELMERLRAMMREANSRLRRRRKSRHIDPFHARVEHHLRSAPPGSLAARCRELPTEPGISVADQMTHWMFAMGETLATNTARALALILAHPGSEARVRAELAAHGAATAAGVGRLTYLGGCVQEAMRLWPTTPMLLRETASGDTLRDEPIPPATQVLILNSFNHRDGERVRFADRFAPEAWADGLPSPLFNHLSSGPQDCAGRHLALFLARAVLATLLGHHRYTLLGPPIRPDRPLPYTYNYFRLRFAARPLAGGGTAPAVGPPGARPGPSGV